MCTASVSGNVRILIRADRLLYIPVLHVVAFSPEFLDLGLKHRECSFLLVDLLGQIKLFVLHLLHRCRMRRQGAPVSRCPRRGLPQLPHGFLHVCGELRHLHIQTHHEW